MLLRLAAPDGNDRGPLYMEQAFAALHQANAANTPLSFILGGTTREVGLFCESPESLAPLVERFVLGCYPEASVAPCHPHVLAAPDGWTTWHADVRLVPWFFPLRTYRDLQDDLNRRTADPLMTLLALLPGPRETNVRATITITVRPATPHSVRRAQFWWRRLRREVFSRHARLLRIVASAVMTRNPLLRGCVAAVLRSSTRETIDHQRVAHHEAIGAKLTSPLFAVQIRLSVSIPQSSRRTATDGLTYLAAAIRPLAMSPAMFILSSPQKHAQRSTTPTLLTSAELATMVHLPTHPVQTEALARPRFRELEPPTNFDATSAGDATLGETAFRRRRERVRIAADDRLRHLLVLGKTGMGKSTLLRSLVTTDIHAGRGVCLIDPHGDLANDVLRLIPTRRTNDVVLFDPTDPLPVTLNVLHCPSIAARSRVASGVLAAFKKLYADSWGPRLEHILRNALLALLDVPGSSLSSLSPLLTDAGFRQQALHHVRDPVVRGFWTREFEQMPARLQAEAVSPVLNKVGQFVSHPLLRRTVAAPGPGIDLRSVLDQNQIMIVNLAKGTIGEDGSSLLGSLLITSLQLAAMTRADMRLADRAAFFLYVDEAHSFATDAFSSILSEGRKYGLAFGAIATQFLEQFNEPTLAALAGNVGTQIAFQLGQRDAEIVAGEFDGEITTDDLTRIPKYHAYARLLIDGHPSRPFSLRTLPPMRPPGRLQRPGILRRASRNRFAANSRGRVVSRHKSSAIA